jgi:hypothetical protein
MHASLRPFPSPQDQTFTVGDLVERISHDGNAAAVGERIKLWTRSGLIAPIDAKFPGTGRHRRYEWPTIIDCAVLNALTDARVEVLARKDTLFALSLAHVIFEDLGKQENRGRQFYLALISFRGKPFSGQTCYRCDDVVEIKPCVESTIVVNLSQIFGRLRGKDLAAS